jgi:hypothetical protein
VHSAGRGEVGVRKPIGIALGVDATVRGMGHRALQGVATIGR